MTVSAAVRFNPGQGASFHFVMGGDAGRIAELRAHVPDPPFVTPGFEGLRVRRIENGK